MICQIFTCDLLKTLLIDISLTLDIYYNLLVIFQHGSNECVLCSVIEVREVTADSLAFPHGVSEVLLLFHGTVTASALKPAYRANGCTRC